MKNRFILLAVSALLALSLKAPASAQIAGKSGADDLIITQNGATQATIVVAADAGTWEKRAAEDLQKYIEMMSGAKPRIFTDDIFKGMDETPLLIVGSAAIKTNHSLEKDLDKVAKKNPTLRADAIVVRRAGNRISLAGTNDESHYYAVAHLLHLWGCRWYLPGELGECIPTQAVLKVGQIDTVYAPPFEIRRALNRNSEGVAEYDRRNFMSSANAGAAMGALSGLTGDIVPAGKTVYEVPFAEDATAQHVADKIAERYAAGVGAISIAPFIGEYSSDSPRDKELRAGVVTKYTGMVSSTDAMLEMSNKVAKILREKYPASKTKLIAIAYASTALPPQHAFKPEPSLVMWLVPVDIDPNHSMDDARSPSRQEYRDIMYRWAEVMEGRVAIYDYEESMLVWRDLPNPHHHVFRRDIKHFQKAGILGFSPETRGSLAINFLNVFMRGQLMWNPDADADALFTEFYPKFYGNAAAPMSDYWRAIFKSWEDTIATEHEYFIAPAIYTPELVSTLRRHIETAEVAIKPLQAKTDLNRHENLYVERMKLARLSFEIIDHYMTMVRAGASEANYKTAVEAGKQGLASVLALAKFNPGLTPATNAKLETIEPVGDASSFAGEVGQYAEQWQYSNGTKGTLIAKTPLEWAFHRDPNDTGLSSGWAYKPADLTYWNANKNKFSVETRKDYPTTQWEMLRTDLYMQAQGVRHPDGQSFTGHAWYRTAVELTPEQARNKVHLRFPGLFNECWLYINGRLVAHRPQKPIWAMNDYKFEWDADLSGAVKAGANTITLRLHNQAYLGGIFRRPFLYKPNQ